MEAFPLMGYDILQFIIVIALLILVAMPLGRYLHLVFFKEKSKLDRVFFPIDGVAKLE
jgi:potassium-transporting ATPase potassium-binding subunit